MSTKKAQQIKNVRKLVKQDKRYRNLKEVLTSDTYDIPFRELLNELKLNHSSRTIGKLDVGDPNFASHVVKACIMDQQYRSRAVEMKVSCNSVCRYLENHLKYFSGYISTEYPEQLKVFSTIKERTLFIDRIIRPFQKHLEKVQDFQSTIDIYISDIDKAGFAVKNIIAAFEVVRRNEGSVNLKT